MRRSYYCIVVVDPDNSAYFLALKKYKSRRAACRAVGTLRSRYGATVCVSRHHVVGGGRPEVITSLRCVGNRQG
jgi:hypothetical protein